MFGAHKIHSHKDRDWLAETAEGTLFIVIALALLFGFYQLMAGWLHLALMG